MEHMFDNADEAKTFLLSGKAIFTIVSLRTQARFTFKVYRPRAMRREQDNGTRFVSVLTGADNNTAYTYMGHINKDKPFRRGNKSDVAADAMSTVALKWFLDKLLVGILPTEIEMWHEGRCGACGKRLTVPGSIASGIGPECAKRAIRCV